MKKIVNVFLFLFVSGCVGMSSGKSPVNIDGTWRGKIEHNIRMSKGGGGEQAAHHEVDEMFFSFKREGDVLKGSVSKSPGQWIPIEDGKIEGNKISFTNRSTFGEREITWNYKGKIKGDKIKIKSGTDVSGRSSRGPGIGGGSMSRAGLRSSVDLTVFPPQTRKQHITVKRISSQPQGPVN
jgi:hypothetical protein